MVSIGSVPLARSRYSRSPAFSIVPLSWMFPSWLPCWVSCLQDITNSKLTRLVKYITFFIILHIYVGLLLVRATANGSHFNLFRWFYNNGILRRKVSEDFRQTAPSDPFPNRNPSNFIVILGHDVGS